MARKKSTVKTVFSIASNNSEDCMVTALRPFADMAQPGDEEHADVVICCRGEFTITFGDLVRAKEALVVNQL